MSSGQKKLQWSLDSINEALKAVNLNGKGLRKVARKFGVFVTICKYCLDMRDMGYGLTVEDVKCRLIKLLKILVDHTPLVKAGLRGTGTKGFFVHILSRKEALSYIRAKNANEL